MNVVDFFSALESELHLVRRPFIRADLQEFVADIWPLAQHDPDAGRWSRAFLESAHRQEQADAQDEAELMALGTREMKRLQWGSYGPTVGILDWMARLRERRRMERD